MVDVFLGTVDLIGRVLGEDVLFHRTLKGLADDSVVMDDRVGGVAVVEDGLIKVFNVLGCERAELNCGGGKVGNHPRFHHEGIALIGGGGDRGLYTVQPFFHVVHEQHLCLGSVFTDGSGCGFLFAFFLKFVLHPNLVQGFLSLAFAGSGNRELGGDPLCLPFAVYLQVKDGIIVTIFLL